jgi:hypothetical protein
MERQQKAKCAFANKTKKESKQATKKFSEAAKELELATRERLMGGGQGDQMSL